MPKPLIPEPIMGLNLKMVSDPEPKVNNLEPP
jgi:hypothetical protein